MSFVRSSKFRHVFGEPHKADYCFTDLKVDGTSDTNCAVSNRFAAVIRGMKVIILPLDQPGRQDDSMHNYIDCKSKVMDLAWSPHNDCMLLTGGEGAEVHGWAIPFNGLTKRMDASDAHWTLSNKHHRKVTFVAWHPVAENIAATGGFDDFIIVWNCEREEEVFRLQVGNQPTSFAWSYNGSRAAITTKEENVISLSIVNPRTGEVYTKNKECNNGSKPTKVVITKNGDILTVGGNRQANRLICLWDKDDVNICHFELEAGCSSGVLNIQYDPDLEIFYTFAKGESVIRYYEINNREIFYLTQFSETTGQKGGNFLPKRGVDSSKCEIARFFKLANNKCVPISFIVPRKSDQFQKDIFPPTISAEAILKADEWVEGKDADPPLMDIREMKGASEKEKPQAKKPKSAPKAAPKYTASYQESNGGGQSAELTELIEDVKILKSTVKKLSKKVSRLEAQLSQENGGEEEEEEEEE